MRRRYSTRNSYPRGDGRGDGGFATHRKVHRCRGHALRFSGGETDWREISRLDTVGVGGYDHSFVVPRWEKGPIALREAAEVRAPKSGRRMLVRTTYPAVHFYSGNHLSGRIGRDGSTLARREALCLECQYFPNAPHRPEFPSIELRPGECYYHITEHEFGTY